MNHLSSESILKLAEENIEQSIGGPKDYSLQYSNIAIGQALIAIALELKKMNWESNYESNMERLREETQNTDVQRIDKDLGW